MPARPRMVPRTPASATRARVTSLCNTSRPVRATPPRQPCGPTPAARGPRDCTSAPWIPNFIEEEEGSMNKDILKGQWTQLRGHTRQQEGKLTDGHVAQGQGEPHG